MGLLAELRKFPVDSGGLHFISTPSPNPVSMTTGSLTLTDTDLSGSVPIEIASLSELGK
jgi:hypothetical protein